MSELQSSALATAAASARGAPPAPPPQAIRLLRFYGVGALGIVIQISTLAALTSLLHLPYLVATALAVETAVLHNFFWHQRFTWSDRRSMRWPQTLARCLRFNATTGAISIAGNLALMRLFAGRLHLPIVAANLLTIASCSLLNFLAADRLVFLPAAVSWTRARSSPSAV